ncbi:MAG TPA: patatin-like phospholipase family protein [Stellaceae bacterium]|nr:patatin-like phospholipase family protein [Stellaceae bacterium]
MAYRILSLDGGGAWALIQVRTLMNLYGAGATGHQVLQKFDLAAANSGGSLVLAGLVENLSLGDIAQYFLDETKRRSIFSPTASFVDAVLTATLGMGPKYSAAAKLPAIERLLPRAGDAPLAGAADGIKGPGGAPVHLLIVGFDYDLNRAVYFRSAAAKGAGLGVGAPAQVTLAGAVHASTNAPVNYFDAPAMLPGAADRYWDGGITGNNNPALVAVVEAMVLGQQAADIRVLSLGTGNVSFPLAAPGATRAPLELPRPDSSLTADLKKLATAIVDDPPDAATFIAHTITGGSGGLALPAVSRVVRMSPQISPLPAAGGGWRPPPGWSVAQLLYLGNIDMDAVVQSDIVYVDDYCASWLADAAPNQSIRANGTVFDPFSPQIGYARFSEARAAWAALFP